MVAIIQMFFMYSIAAIVASVIAFPILGTYFYWLVEDLNARYESKAMVWFWVFFCIGTGYTGTIAYLMMRPEGSK